MTRRSRCRDYWPKSPKATPPEFPHIACFDDTGLEAARGVSFAPVIGIGEAAFHLASMLGRRFSVVMTLSRSIAATRKQSVEVRTGPSLRQGASMRTSGSFTR
jgi:hypothetical protein